MTKKAHILILPLLACFVKITYGQNIRRFQDMSAPLSLEENYESGNKLFTEKKYYSNIDIDGSVFEDNKAKVDEMVYLTDENQHIIDSTRTNENGRFRFRNLPGNKNYVIMIDGNDNMQVNMSFLDDNGQELLSVNSNDDEAYFLFQKLKDKPVTLKKLEEEYIVISGNLSMNGQPAPGEKVVLVNENGKMVASTYSDTKGKFHFRNMGNSSKYTLRMDDNEEIRANMDFLDQDDNLLLSTNSEDNLAYFDYQDLSEVIITSRRMTEEDTQPHKPEKSQAEQLRDLFKGTMSYNEYHDLVKKHGKSLIKDINLRVQIGAFRKPRKGWYQELDLGKIDVIRSRGFTKFLVGNFDELEEAEVLRKQAFDKGIDDAFISVYYRGTRVALLIYNEKKQLVRKFKENND